MPWNRLIAVLFADKQRLTLPAYALLLLFSLAMFLPGFFTIPPWDRDESRFAEASRQMLASGDWVDIRFQDEVRYKKPAGIYWLQAGSVAMWHAVSGDARDAVIWPYRLPSLLGAVLAVLLTARIGAQLFNPKVGLVAGLLVATCLLLNVEVRMAKTDAMLLATVLLAQSVLAKAFCRAAGAPPLLRREALCFWLAVSAGILLKGPIILLSAFGTLLVLALWRVPEPKGLLKQLRPLAGLGLTLAVTAPWFYLISQRSHGSFFKDSAGDDLLGKLLSGHAWGVTPPGYHLLGFWLVFWPGSLIVFLALPWLWQNRNQPMLRFLLAWIIPVWLVFELTPSKLPHYILPAIPALAIAASAWVFSGKLPMAVWRQAVTFIWLVISVGICLAPLALPLLVEQQLFYPALALGSFGLAAAWAGGVLIRQQKMGLAVGTLPVAGLAVMAALFGSIIPHLPHAFISPLLAEALHRQPLYAGCDRLLFGVAGYDEPSLIFLAGAETRLLHSGNSLAAAMQDNPCMVGAVEAGEVSQFRATAQAFNLAVAADASVAGFNYDGFKAQQLTFYRRQASQTSPR